MGHSAMDLDCIGSIVMASYLFPGFQKIKSARIHPAAKNLYNMYEGHLDFTSLGDIRGQRIDHLVVVDTRAKDQIDEYLKELDTSGAVVEVFDHHPPSRQDISYDILHESDCGANTTQLVNEITQRGIMVSREDATIALTAIYADCGNFLHANVSAADFRAAEYLLERGAELNLVKDFLIPLREKNQIALFHEVLNKMEEKPIRGHRVQVCYLEMAEDTQGLGAVIEKVFEVENSEMLFGFFYFTDNNRMLVIARNACEDFHLNDIMSTFGGGGHKHAAAATIKTNEGEALFRKFLCYLEEVLLPAATAEDIMTEQVSCLKSDMSILDASLFLEAISHSGAPVTTDSGRLEGILTLKEIMKARKLGKMHVPVSAFMLRNQPCVEASTRLNEIEELLYESTVSHLPVLRDGTLAGLITRTDFLDYMRGETGRKKNAAEKISRTA